MTTLINSAAPKSFQVFSKSVHPNIVNAVANLSRSPEIQKLSDLVENNLYHDHENVLDHVQAVFANIQELLKFEFVKSDELQKKYLTYFNEILDKNGNYKRIDLLILAACLHDVGKGLKKDNGKPCFEIIDEQGNTMAFGHDHLGAMIVPQLLCDYDLTPKEISIVQALVDLHDTFNETFCRAYLTKKPEKDIPILRQKQPLFYVELLLHILSDNAGAKSYQQWFEYLKDEIFQQESFLKYE